MDDTLTQWLAEKLGELSILGEGRKDVLIDLKSRLNHLDNQSLLELSEVSNFNDCWACLSRENLEEAELASDIICLVLNVLTAEQAFGTYGAAIENALSHPSPAVKKNFLKLLLKYVSVDCLVMLTTHLPGIIRKVLECLACPDRSIAEGSVQFFKQIGKSPEGAQLLLSGDFSTILKNIMTINDITRFRIYEIVVDLAVKHTAALEAGHNCGILSSLAGELKSSDTLIQLNVLELLTNLTANRAGLLYLQQQGVIQFLVDQIINITNEPLSYILLPGLIEFFGNLYKLQPSVFSQQHPEVLQLLFNSFDTVDPALLGVLVSTIGKIGFTDEGKHVLLANQDGFNVFLKKMGELIERKDALCVSAMNTLSIILQTDNEELQRAARTWFEGLGPNALQVLLSTAKLPFVEMRQSALLLLGVLATHTWGTQLICRAPGALEFLQDRNVEFDKDCKIAKHDVIRSLVSNPILPETVNSDLLIKLRQHVNEGAFYVAAELQTAFEQG